jgi:hypothetical protein
MSRVRVIVVSPEEAYDGIAEFWCGAELMALTTLSEGPAAAAHRVARRWPSRG